MLTPLDIRVGHAGDGYVGIVLAAAVPRQGLVHQMGGQLVLEQSADDALLDEQGLMGDGSFVVDGVRAARAGDGRIVIDRHGRGADPLAALVPEDAGLFAGEVGLQQVADGLVDEHAGVARGQDDRHLAGRGVPGVEQVQRLPGGLRSDGFRRERAVEIFQADAASSARIAILPDVPALGDAHAGQLQERPGIANEKAFGVDDENILDEVLDRSLDLLDGRIGLLAGGVGPADQVDLGLEGGLMGRSQSLVEAVVDEGFAQINRAQLGRAGRNSRRR